MKKLFWLSITICFLGACKKAIEERKEEIILDAMTNGQWYVYSFKEGTVDHTAAFDPYVFQFYRDGRVSGLSEGNEDKGTWVGDANALTITSNFPDATDPVKKLNAVWKITNNSWDYVKAQSTVEGVQRLLHLKKK
jgi:hypothetical protein